MRRVRRALLAGAIAAALVAAGVAVWRLGPWADPFHLPRRLVLEETLADLSASFAPDAVASQAANDPVRQGGFQPGPPLAVSGAYRQAIVAPPRSRVRFRAHVAPGARLRLGVGVERDAARGKDAAGVLFTVDADDRRRYARVINPAARHRDRRWFDEDIDLGADGEREMEITLGTEAGGDPARLAGTPGWSHVRVVRRLERDRQPGAAAPNVLVLLVDTLRADRLGCYGAVPSPSPNLDRLAAEGRVFAQAVSQAPWTLPAVATFLTGLYPRAHGMVAGQHAGADTLAAGDAGDPSYLSDAIPTIADEAARAGITTVGVSASPLVSRDTNLARGFETFVEFGWDDVHEQWVRAGQVNAAFLQWLARNRAYRFFAYLHYMDVHDPYTPPPAFRPAPPPGLRPAVASGAIGPLAAAVNRHGAPPLPEAEVAFLRRLYDGEIAGWDAELAHLLAGLAASGVAEGTVLVVLSDHGEEFQEHGKLKHAIHLYDELLRVPLVMHGRGIPRGRVAAQVQGIDVYPSLAALLGLPARGDLPGHELLAAADDHPAFSETRYGIAPDGTSATLAAVRTPGWKLIHAPALGRYELYDLAHDPGERDDRFGAEPEGARLAALLAGWEGETPRPPSATGQDPRLQEKLRALGYVD